MVLKAIKFKGRGKRKFYTYVTSLSRSRAWHQWNYKNGETELIKYLIHLLLLVLSSSLLIEFYKEERPQKGWVIRFVFLSLLIKKKKKKKKESERTLNASTRCSSSLTFLFCSPFVFRSDKQSFERGEETIVISFFSPSVVSSSSKFFLFFSYYQRELSRQ